MSSYQQISKINHQEDILILQKVQLQGYSSLTESEKAQYMKIKKNYRYMAEYIQKHIPDVKVETESNQQVKQTRIKLSKQIDNYNEQTMQIIQRIQSLNQMSQRILISWKKTKDQLIHTSIYDEFLFIEEKEEPEIFEENFRKLTRDLTQLKYYLAEQEKTVLIIHQCYRDQIKRLILVKKAIAKFFKKAHKNHTGGQKILLNILKQFKSNIFNIHETSTKTINTFNKFIEQTQTSIYASEHPLQQQKDNIAAQQAKLIELAKRLFQELKDDEEIRDKLIDEFVVKLGKDGQIQEIVIQIQDESEKHSEKFSKSLQQIQNNL